jgi:precorrin-6B methylase 2
MAATATAPAPAPASAPVTPARIHQMMWGFVPPLAIETAVRDGIFDALDGRALTLDDLAAATGASPRGLRAVANLLAAIGLLARDGDRFALTPESENFLVSTKPAFQGGVFRHMSSQLLPHFLHLSEVVRTGQPVTPVDDVEEGSKFFAQLVPEIFPLSYPAAKVLAASLPQLRRGTPVRALDIATGSGVWGIALAQASPDVQVTAVDMPVVLEVTRQMTARFHLADRFQYIAGNLREVDLGSGYDVATLGHILHSEGERASRELLRKVFNALASGGTIAIAEFLVDDDRRGPVGGLIFAVNMLVNTSEGDTYSFETIRSWMEEIGYVNARLLDAPGPSPLILADKP